MDMWFSHTLGWARSGAQFLAWRVIGRDLRSQKRFGEDSRDAKGAGDGEPSGLPQVNWLSALPWVLVWRK
jgi:hypothetical protein